MLLPTRAVVLQYNKRRFCQNYTALLDGKIEQPDFHDRVLKLDGVGDKTAPPPWIPWAHFLLDLLVGVTGCALMATDAGGNAIGILPGMLILLAASVVFRLRYLKCKLYEFRKELTALCTSFTALDDKQDGQGLVWEINGSPKWAWPYTFATSWFTGENRAPFRIDVLICDSTDMMMKIDVEIARKTREMMDNCVLDFDQEKLEPFGMPASPVSIDTVTCKEPNVIHTIIPFPSPPSPDISGKAILARSYSLISKMGHRRNSSDKSCRTLPRRHHRLLSRTPQRVPSGHDGYFSGGVHAGGRCHGSILTCTKGTNSRGSSMSTFTSCLDGKPFLNVPMPTPPAEWPVSPFPPAMDSISAEVIVYPVENGII